MQGNESDLTEHGHLHWPRKAVLCPERMSADVLRPIRCIYQLAKTALSAQICANVMVGWDFDFSEDLYPKRESCSGSSPSDLGGRFKTGSVEPDLS